MTTPEPVAAAPDEIHPLAELADLIHDTISPPGTDRCHDDGDGYVQCFHIAETLLASDWLRDHDARVVAEAKSEADRRVLEAQADAWDEGWAARAQTKPGNYSLVHLAQPYRAALVGGPDETNGDQG